ncbi:hypothetical protein EWM64_g1517 [Hericium alpestre]|uniref:Protein kinase domain-containing protein n=1 Tax=Hericium alpestre TaxID=135208 RepID=A0A4Z0A895_9AGAM|nr:hypothetical protein EWM64_g1517 [Hericium alpestre]
MSDLYPLQRSVREILTEWLDTRPPIPNTFEGPPRVGNNEDYIFSNGRNQVRPQEDTVSAAVVPVYPPSPGISPLEFDPKKLKWGRRLDDQSSDNAVFEVTWDGQPFVMKVNRQTENDQNSRQDRHRAELNAYKRLLQSKLCDAGVVPQPYGYFHIWGQQHVGWLSHVNSFPYGDKRWLRDFTNPAEYPRAILFERIPNVARLPRDQFTRQNMFDLFDTVERIHREGIAHRDMEARNVLWNGNHFVIVDFDNAQLLPEGKHVSKSKNGKDLADMWQNFIFNKW